MSKRSFFVCMTCVLASSLLACGAGGSGDLPPYDPGLGEQVPVPAGSNNGAGGFGGGTSNAPAPTFGPPAPGPENGDARPGDGGGEVGDGGDGGGDVGETGADAEVDAPIDG